MPIQTAKKLTIVHATILSTVFFIIAEKYPKHLKHPGVWINSWGLEKGHFPIFLQEGLLKTASSSYFVQYLDSTFGTFIV